MSTSTVWFLAPGVILVKSLIFIRRQQMVLFFPPKKLLMCKTLSGDSHTLFIQDWTCDKVDLTSCRVNRKWSFICVCGDKTLRLFHESVWWCSDSEQKLFPRETLGSADVCEGGRGASLGTRIPTRMWLKAFLIAFPSAIGPLIVSASIHLLQWHRAENQRPLLVVSGCP